MTLVEDGLLPSAVLEIGNTHACLTRVALGTTQDAVFDLASLTKVLATGLVATHLVGARTLDLDRRVADLVPEWRRDDRVAVTVRDLLAHASGLPAHRPLYREHDGVDTFVPAIAAMPIEIAARSGAIYSDLGFIVLGRLLEVVAEEGLETMTHDLLSLLGDDTPRFTGVWPGRDVQPTGYSEWRGRSLRGEVHDDNAAALHGVAGHAGLFGAARGIGAVARVVLAGLDGRDTPLAPAWAVRAFARRSPVPGSSRALAWDTALGTSSCGSQLSRRALGHTGFTGTSLWLDVELDLYVVLLTNRVAGRASAADMSAVRRALHDIVGGAWRESRGA